MTLSGIQEYRCQASKKRLPFLGHTEAVSVSETTPFPCRNRKLGRLFVRDGRDETPPLLAKRGDKSGRTLETSIGQKSGRSVFPRSEQYLMKNNNTQTPPEKV